MNTISTCLWLNNQAEEAARLYTGLFKNSKMGNKAFYSAAASKQSGQPAGALMTQEITLENHTILLLNGGPMFQPTPAGSFTVWCESEAEADGLWKKLSDQGNVRMEYQAYPWAKKYGWTADRYGFDWQLIFQPDIPHKKKIAPSFLFVDKSFGKAEEAVNFWISKFPNSKIENLARDPSNGSVMHCMFTIDGQPLVAMDGAGTHGWKFTEAFSIMVGCANQKEIDYFWSNLIEGGGKTSMCGWLTDRFGVSWQLVPDTMSDVMADPNKSERVQTVVMKQTKPILADIEAAARG